VAEKLFIEPENEDEMRRLVLVQLARMAVRGDWDGFLTGGGGGGAPTDAEYVVMALNGTLTNERKLTAGTRITITDGGAGGNVTIAADASPVTSLVAGTNITLSPVSGLGDVTVNAANSPVTSLVAGTNITLSPVSGLGDVTITAASPTGLAPNDASYLTLGLDGDLTNERVLTAGTGISFTDTGANGTLTIETTGGGGSSILPGAGDMGSTFDTLMASGGLFGGNTMSTSTYTWSNSYVHFVPIVFPKAVSITTIQYSILSGSFTGKLGLYSSGSNGSPDSLEVETGLQSAVTSGYYSAAVSSTAVTANTLYWLGIAQGDTASSVGLRAMKNDAQGGNYVYITDISNFNSLQMRTSVQVGTDTALPATITTSELESLYGLHPMLGVGF
jgi:hypothetical protein